MKLFIITFIVLSFQITSYGQSSEKDALFTTLENYMSGQRSRAEMAFHPSATMKFIHFETGEFKDVPIAEYLGRLSDTPPAKNSAGEWKKEIESYNIEGNAAQAKIRIDAGKFLIYDYMNLLKVNGEWKIVSKVFNRQNK